VNEHASGRTTTKGNLDALRRRLYGHFLNDEFWQQREPVGESGTLSIVTPQAYPKGKPQPDGQLRREQKKPEN